MAGGTFLLPPNRLPERDLRLHAHGYLATAKSLLKSTTGWNMPLPYMATCCSEQYSYTGLYVYRDVYPKRRPSSFKAYVPGGIQPNTWWSLGTASSCVQQLHILACHSFLTGCWAWVVSCTCASPKHPFCTLHGQNFPCAWVRILQLIPKKHPYKKEVQFSPTRKQFPKHNRILPTSTSYESHRMKPLSHGPHPAFKVLTPIKSA